MTSLRELQQRFQDYLVEGSDEIVLDIVSSEDALAEHRLGAYYNAYRIRLIDCLAVDYQAVERILGREVFEELALDYLDRFPSTDPSVRWFGRNLPRYLRECYQGAEREFLLELASYEWAKSSVFDAADSESLVEPAQVAQLPPEDWPALTFDFQPALAWLDLHWNVPQIEKACADDADIPDRIRDQNPRRWLLWRRDLKIYWRSLDVDEAWAIEQAAEGVNFAAICEGLLEWVDSGQVALRAAGLLRQWVTDGLLLRLGRD